MEIEKIKLNDIIPTDYNPRTITNEEITKLRNSINTFGMVDPIIINLKNKSYHWRASKVQSFKRKECANIKYYPIRRYRLGFY